MRSCAFFIFEAATISIAFVILRVFCTLLILVRISLLPGMSVVPSRFAVTPALSGARAARSRVCNYPAVQSDNL
jgi:hypothetical protein